MTVLTKMRTTHHVGRAVSRVIYRASYVGSVRTDDHNSIVGDNNQQAPFQVTAKALQRRHLIQTIAATAATAPIIADRRRSLDENNE